MEQKRPGQDAKRPGGERHSQGGSTQPTQSQLLPLAAQSDAADPVHEW